jgi:hypothetical protein
MSCRPRLAPLFFIALGFLAPWLFSDPITAQSRPTLTWQAEVRPRLEVREPVAGEWIGFTSMRTRIGLQARVEEGLGLFIQIQDVRAWGEETSPRDRSADALDVHQAYLEIEHLPLTGGTLRAGRQEVAIGESRLVGAPDWGQAGQAFNGARWLRPLGAGALDLTFLQIRESFLSLVHEYEEVFLAASYALPLGRGGTAQVYLLHDRDTEQEGTRQTSLAGIWRKETGLFSFRIQGIHQTGDRKGLEVRAYLLALSASLKLLDENASITLWYDRLSGDEDPEDDVVRVFSTLFGARNRYYGKADYFLSIPLQTGGLGLQDAAAKLAFSPSSILSLNLDLHAFRTSTVGELSSRRLGEEVDAWVRYRFRNHLAVQCGYSLTWAGPGMEELGILQGMGNFGYLMTSLRF